MRRTLIPLLAASLVVGCDAAPMMEPDEGDDDIVVSEGKADDFFSVSAREYFVTGTASVIIEDSYAGKSAAERLKRAKELVPLKNVQISWFLNTYLIDKEDDEDNSRYGGLGALTRFASEENEQLTAVNGTAYRFTYRVQVAGSRNLIGRIPGTSGASGKSFKLQMGKVSNADLARLEYNHEWYRDDPWSEFDPGKVRPDQLDPIDLTIAAQAGSRDAFIAHDRLFADGELTMAVHFGWDYNDRYDISGSRALYNWLLSKGFQSPVATYEKYLRTSGPLTKTINSNRRPIAVKLWLFHPGDAAQGVPGPDPDTDAGGRQLEDDMRKSFAEREVILFEGHSGSLYGFALANWRKTDEGDLDDSEIPSMALSRDYQIVMADGCDTYALGQAFWQNPAKADHKSINVITSTSFSNAGTEASAKRLIDTVGNQRYGKVAAVKISDLVSGLDADQGVYFNTMFGVHGVDANPKYDPLADRTSLCQTCSSAAACGGDGNRCTRISSSQRVCTFACIDDTGCPTGYACRQIASSATGTIVTRQCVPRSLSCR